YITAHTLVKINRRMGGFLLKKYIVVLFMLMIILPQKTLDEEDIITYIIEVEGNPSVHASSIERQYPSLEVVETFTILLQALAVKGKPEDINELLTESFVKNVYDVQTYEIGRASCRERGEIEEWGGGVEKQREDR